MPRLIYHFLLATVLLAVLLFLIVTADASGYEHDLDEEARVPRLVGYGCKGSSGPLYANEEDHFPKCKRIEGWR